jgi:hypothetical protein
VCHHLSADNKNCLLVIFKQTVFIFIQYFLHEQCAKLILIKIHKELLDEIEVLKSQNLELEKLNKWYEEQLKLNKKRMYGASSEKTDEALDQLNFFNEAEAERVPINPEPAVETIA